MRGLIFSLTLLSSVFSHSAEWNQTNAEIVSTPRATTRLNPTQARGQNSANKLFSQINEIERAGRINCNRSLTNAGDCAMCNCLNEADPGASLDAHTLISKVVFSRLKSSQYPNTVCGVVCDKLQFSWVNRGFNEQCQRTGVSNPPHFNTRSLDRTNSKFNKCAASIKIAAQDQFVDNPDSIFALNYLNPRYSTDRSWLARCRQTQVGPVVGDHVFCNPYLRRETYTAPGSEAIAYQGGPFRHVF